MTAQTLLLLSRSTRKDAFQCVDWAKAKLAGEAATYRTVEVEAYLPSASLEPVPGAPFWVGWRALDRF